MAPLKISSAQMVADARARIEELACDTAIALHHSQAGSAEVVFVDLRDVRERQRTGYISGSFHCPRGMLEFWVDPESPYFKTIFAAGDKRFVFYCASGWRSALSVALLQDMGFEAAHLRDGFSGWTKAGGPVEMPGDDPERGA
ncbi:rhodanese-like domain-containing protein [Phaeobacter sp. B1627]|uniref:rhodanese-like domain-containing protein n=1 Tax=Phaeobacter sp. B1627 TaxID=2583809 RepID=UPI00111B5ED5|nr:rhodanese-like domain-containing protein [Phaeobacter sp. B1627]TNJ48444.1 rhodanese-like domain-containing protein [Phaeobacter sp. B1627]